MSRDQLRELVEEHYDRLFRAARFLCGDLSAAEDLVQETFAAAATSLSRFRGKSSPYTWLYGIMLNKFRRWLRQKGRRPLSLQAAGRDDDSQSPEHTLAADGPLPEEAARRNEATELVRQAVGQLSADHRMALELRFVEDLPYEEIARILDCPVGTAKSRVHYALRKVGAELGADSPEGESRV
jgi:RNA polymerase sigma-70 factor (ECF subfamily)